MLLKRKDCYVNNLAKLTLHIIIFLFFIIAARPSYPMGESDDYMLTTIALKNHFSLQITREDVEEAKQAFPNHAAHIQSSWDTGMPALFSVKEGEVYPWYMGTYSFTCIPAYLCLGLFGFNQSYAFAFTNAALAALALCVCWLKLKTSTVKKWILIVMLGFSPILPYIWWPSAEVFIFSFVTMSLVFFANRQYHMAGLLVSIAGTMNIAIMAYGLFIIVDYTKETYEKHSRQGEKNILQIIRLEWKSIGLLIVCFLPSLVTPIFNIVKFQRMNLQSILGFAVPQQYLNRVWSYLFDLNMGFLPYFLIAFPAFLGLVIASIVQKKWRSFIYFGAFLGTVMLYAITYHSNSGMTGLPRYSAWTFPIFLFYMIAENEYSRKWMTYIRNNLLVISTIITLGTVLEKTSNIQQTNIAKWVLDHAPECYYPSYSIFISRVAHISGGYTPYKDNVPKALVMEDNYQDYFPVIYCDGNGNVRKILSIPEFTDTLVNYFTGTEQELSELEKRMEKVKSKKGMYYINLKGGLKIKDEYVYERFIYTYGEKLKMGNIPLSLFAVTDGGMICEDFIQVPTGVYQYGPYLQLDKGKYVITISGENLNQFSEDVMIDNAIMQIDEIERSNHDIKYAVVLEHDGKEVQLRGINQGEDDVLIQKVELSLYE